MLFRSSNHVLNDNADIKIDYQKEIEEFRTNFYKFKNKNIVLYGVGRYTATLVPELKEFNFVGLMDRDSENIGKVMYGLPVISKNDAEKKADLIIINTAETYWKIIYKRICQLSVPVYFLNGKLASIEEDRRYEDNSYWKKSYQQLCQIISNFEIISFDIFDTLIMRNVYAPQDIFKIVERRIVKELGLKIDFARVRSQVGLESNDRLLLLDDIYKIMNCDLALPNDVLDVIKNIELQVEKEFCVARKDMVELYNTIVLEKEVYLISDMYLSSETIKEILWQCGISYIPHIWISAEKKANKKSGTLWERYKGEIIKDRKALHIGDNIFSDIKIPQKLGIETYYVMNGMEMWEKSSLGEYVPRIEGLEESFFAGLIAARIFNSPFALCKSKGKVLLEKFEDLGYCIFGGIIYSFFSWLLKQVEKKGIGRLVFFARDGYFLQKDYEYLRSNYCKEIPSSIYLAISRRLILISSYEKEEDLDNILKFPYCGSFHDYMQDRLNVEILKEDTNYWSEINLPQDLNKIKEWVSPYRCAILDQIRQERNNYLSYIEKMNINEKDAVIDLWFYGNNQYYLSKLLNKSLTGFYFVVNKSKTNKCNENNKLFSCFQSAEDQYAVNSEVKKGDLWIESFLTAPYGMIKSVGRKGEYICASGGMNQKYFTERELINQGVCEFIHDFLMLVPDNITNLNELFVDSFFGECLRDHIELSHKLKRIFYYDNAIVKRWESKIFD